MEWPLVGRDAELGIVDHAIHRYRATRSGAAVAVTGAAGVGKTRLLRAAVEAAAGSHLEVEWVLGAPGLRGIPFGAFAAVIPVPERGPSDRLQLLQVARRELDGRARNGGLVLAIDDAHQLDEPSAALMHQLAASGATLVLAAFREGEPRPEGLEDLLRLDATTLAALEPLQPGEVIEAVERALEGPLDGRARAELVSLSGGNPLFLRTLVEGLVSSGQLAQRAGRWELLGRVTPPESVKSLLRPRLEALSREEREATDLVALGEPLELGLLEAAVAPVASLERSGIVAVEARSGRWYARLSHPLLSEVVVADLGETQRRRAYGRLAKALEEQGSRRREDALRLGVWKLRGGDAADAGLLAEAADRALIVFDYELALELADAALARERSSLALSVRGRALAALGRSREALTDLREGARLATSDAELATTAVALGYLLFFGLGQRDEGLALLESTSARVRDPDWRGELVCAAAYLRGVLGDFTGMERIEEDVLARGDASPRVEVTALLMMGAGNMMRGALEDARRHVERGLELAGAVSSVYPAAGDLLHANAVLLAWHEGRLEEAAALAQANLERALAEVTNDVAGLFSSIAADVALPRGDVGTAVRLATDATRHLAARDPIGWLPLAHATLALALSHIGEIAEAHTALGAVDAMPLDARGTLMVGRARAWLAGLEAPPESAGAELLALGIEAAQGNYLVWAAFTLHDAVRLGRGREARPLLERLAGAVEGDLVAAMARQAAALADGDWQRLVDVAQRFEAMGAVLYAAEALAQGAAATPAESAERARLATLAASLFDRLPGVVVPARRHVLSPLTAREREIAWLAAQGRTSREIADSLVVSTRTVDNHLGHVYAKLDLSGRDDLVAVLLGRARDSLERGTRA